MKWPACWARPSPASPGGTGDSRSFSSATSRWSPTAWPTWRCRGSGASSSAPTSRTSTPWRGPPSSIRRVVRAPDQTGLRRDETRFVMSLRAVGEGHISSIEFRTGVLDGNSTVTFDPLGPCLVTGDRAPPAGYDKASFRAKLHRARRGQRRRLGDRRSASGAVHARRPRSETERVRARRRTARDRLRDGQDHPRARRVELRDGVPRRLRDLRAGDLPGGPARDARHGGRPLRPVHRRRRRGDVLRDLHGVRRVRDHAAADRDQRLRVVPHLDAHRRPPRRTREWRCSRGGSTGST